MTLENVPPSAVVPANPALQDQLDDIGELSHLNEPALFHLVASRYARRQIYTRAGPVLVAVNPYSPQPALYSKLVLEAFQRRSTSGANGAGSGVPPHVWEVASAAFEDLVARGASQSIAINGESGAGKTESCKLILSYLTHVASGGSTARARTERLARQLHATNPLLEAFGNAKTTRNDNSSRFGRFTSLHFSGSGSLIGAAVERYLLEKSRVTSIERGERSFHIFYQLCAGSSPTLRSRLQLADGAAAQFRVLSSGGCLAIPGVDDSAAFGEVGDALRLLLREADPAAAALASKRLGGMGAAAHLVRGGAQSEEWLWGCLAAVLHLCNVTFVEGLGEGLGGVGAGGAAAAMISDMISDEPNEEAKAVGSGGIDDGDGGEGVSLHDQQQQRRQGWAGRSRAALASAADLWQLDPSALEKAITRRTIAAGSELCELRMSCPEACAARDALAKATYERVFDALIELINQRLASGGQSARGLQRVTADGRRYAPGGQTGPTGAAGGGCLDGGCIGLLDIFGTEAFAVNGFEQLLINYANERLQQLFTTTAIQRVQAEYTAEGLPWDVIEYKDNAPVVELLEGKPISVLSALDDQGLVAGSTDASFIRLLHARFGNGLHPAFDAPRVGHAGADGVGGAFVIRHFAAPVTYSADGGGFLSKNKDTLVPNLPVLMRSSGLAFVRELFADERATRADGLPQATEAGDRAGFGAGFGASFGVGVAGGGGGGGGGGSGGGGGQQQARGRARARYVSVSAQFRHSMAALASLLSSTAMHFIRCIKPNESRAAFQMVPRVALAQLRSCGVLEAVRVSQAGYPTRMLFEELVRRYFILVPQERRGVLNSRPSSRCEGSTSAPPTEPPRILGAEDGRPGLERRDSYDRRRKALGLDHRDSYERRARLGAEQATAISPMGLRTNESPSRTPPLPTPSAAVRSSSSLDVLRAQAATLLGSLGLDDGSCSRPPFMLGKSMAFLASGVLASLEAARTASLHRAIARVQALERRRQAVRRHSATLAAVARLQRAARRFEGARWARTEGRALLKRLRTERATREGELVAQRRRQEEEEEAEEAQRWRVVEDARAIEAEQEVRPTDAAAEAAREVRDARETALVEAARMAQAQVESLLVQLARARTGREAADAPAAERQEAARGLGEGSPWLGSQRVAGAGTEADAEASGGCVERRSGLMLRRSSSDDESVSSARSTAVEQAVEDSVTSIMALAWARQELEAVTKDLEASRREASALTLQNEELQEAVAELEEDIEVVMEDKRELEELNYSYEAQLEEYEATIERREDELHGVTSDLADARVGLREAKEESLRLMAEVSWLRRRLEERDDEVQRAAESNVRLVERWSQSQDDVTYARPNGVSIEIGIG